MQLHTSEKKNPMLTCEQSAFPNLYQELDRARDFLLNQNRRVKEKDLKLDTSADFTGNPHGEFHVMISSNCNPQMWVPQYWCEKQFYEICAEFDGIGNKRYGPGGCQLFNIY